MITWIIIAGTALISLIAWRDPALMDKLQFNAAKIIHQKQYYRVLTHAFIHANWTHLLVNMLVLYFFGRAVESYFHYFSGKSYIFWFLLLYGGGIAASVAYSLPRYRNNYYYNALGASGAVSAVLFSFIFLNPWEKLYFFGLIPIPGILFAFLYLIYSWYLGKRGNDNIAHDAHFLGAVYGFFFPILIEPELLSRFIDLLFKIA